MKTLNFIIKFLPLVLFFIGSNLQVAHCEKQNSEGKGNTDMVITKVEVYKLNINLKEPFKIAMGTQYDSRCIALKIYTNKGIYGVGEASPILVLNGETQETSFEMAKLFSKVIIGKNPLEIRKRMDEINHVTPWHNTTKSAFDMALYDIASKQANLPLFLFLGGSNDKLMIIDRTVSIDSPDIMAAKAKLLVDGGITEIKVKLGKNAAEDILRVKAIREKIGNAIPIKIDANQGWNEMDALKVLTGIKEFNIEYAEQPIAKDNIDGMARLAALSPIPIMADESLFDHRDALNLVKHNACQLFNIKLSKSGGIYNGLKILAIAEAADITCQVGCMMETRLGLTALAHFACASKMIKFYDIDSNFGLTDDPVKGGIQFIDNSRWILPDSIGLGADFDEEYLSKMEKCVIEK